MVITHTESFRILNPVLHAALETSGRLCLITQSHGYAQAEKEQLNAR